MTSKPDAFLAWPGRRLRETLPLCAAFAATFFVCYGGASLRASRLADLPAWDLPFEASVPFVPELAVVYLTITPVLLLAPFVFRTRGELVPLAVTLMLETIVATVFFLAFPQKTALEKPAVDGLAGALYGLADTMNLEHNEFPSLHVAFAVTAGWAYARRSRSLGRVLWPAWSLAVALSTWLIREHHLADIAGGIALATIGMLIVYRRLERADARSTLWAELCCLEQCARFSMRHRRYFVIFLAIWLPSLTRWKETRVVRYAFCAAQWIDDLLDGDRRTDREPLEVVDELLDAMVRRQFSSAPLQRLTAALFDELDAFRSLDVDPHGELIDLVREMRVDRERVLAGAAWEEERLDEHLRRTFELSVDLMLIATGCRARASDVPSLVRILAWCSVFRDLEDDVRHGLVNVPRDVWSSASPAGRPLDARDLRACAAIHEWSDAALRESEALIPEAGREIEALGDARARKILGTFQKSIARFAARQRRHNGGGAAAQAGVKPYHGRRLPDPPDAERA